MKIFVSVPSKGSVTIDFMTSVIRMLAADGIVGEFHPHRGGSELPRCRDEETETFLEGDCDKFLTIDDDMIFQPEHVNRIASHDEQIVGGFYYLKDRSKRLYVCETIAGAQLKADERGLVPLRYIGTGFLCIHRDVFGSMHDKYMDEWYYPEGTEKKRWNFWPVGLDKKQRRWLGEDWWFCHRAGEMGIPIYGDSKVVLGHVGQITYPV